MSIVFSVNITSLGQYKSCKGRDFITNEYENYKNGVMCAFSDCDDIILRESGQAGARFAIIFLKGITDRQYVSEMIIRPMLFIDKESFDGNFGKVIECPSLKTPKDINDAFESVAKGEVLVLTDSEKGFFQTLVNAEKTPSRAITEPNSDVTLRGPRAGFIEDSETNMAILRKYIRTPDLKFRRFTVGSVSSTKVILTYVSGRADEKTLNDIASRLENMQASVIIDSANIQMLLEGNKNPILPSCGSTEKVDKLASKLMAGRIGIIVDGSPYVLTLPFVFAESIQSADDYLHTPYYATFIRLLRTFAFIAAIFAPAVLCAAVKYNQNSMPKEFYGIISEARKDIPLSFFWEIAAVLLLFEILREVGVRMPRTVGDAVGIVGSIILGNTAVEAGIVSSVGVITVAFAAVCSFITPAYMYVIVLARLGILALAELFGVFGIGLGAIVLLLLMCGKTSFGAPYMSPLSPFDKRGMQDFIFSWPKKTLGRKERFK